MKHIYILIFSLITCLAIGQDLVQLDLTSGSNSRTINKVDGIYFTGFNMATNESGVYYMDQSENFEYIVPQGSILFEHANYIYCRALPGNTGFDYVRFDPVDHIPQIFYQNPDVIALSDLVQYANKFYFIAYEAGAYNLYRLDDTGTIESFWTVPGPVQNTVRLHEVNDKLYLFSNTLAPSAQHFYEFDPITEAFITIPDSSYPAYPFPNPPQSIEIDTEIFSLNSDGQLISDLSADELTCFELDLIKGGPDLNLPFLLGSIGDNVYINLSNNVFGSSSGIYRYPEMSTDGLCGDDVVSDEVDLHFDGIDDRVQFQSPFSGDHSITVEMWVKSESFSTGDCDNSDSANLDWIFCSSDGDFGIVDCAGDYRIVFRPLCPFGNGLCSSLPTVPINDNQWHHLAIAEGSGSGFRVWFDGEFLVNFDTAVYDLSGIFTIGDRTNSGGGNPFKGEIDEFRIWDHVRTDEEIEMYHKCNMDPNEEGLVVYFNFNDGDAMADNTNLSQIVDHAGNDQNGDLLNFQLTGSNSNFLNGNPPLINCISSVSDIENVYEIQLYPNPVANQLIIESGNEGISEIAIFSTDGRLLINQKVQHSRVQQTVETQQLNPGLHFVRIKMKDGNMASSRFIKCE